MNVPERCWWSRLQLEDWYRGQVLAATRIAYWGTREHQFDWSTRALHVGLKLADHWYYWKVSSYVAGIGERIEAGQFPLRALQEKVIQERKNFVTFEFIPSLTMADLSDKTKARIKAHTMDGKHPSSLNSPMGPEGQAILRSTYRLVTEELGKGDPRASLANAMTQPLYISKRLLLMER